MYEDICYKRNYIKEVICRLDFATQINILNSKFPKKLYEIVKVHYPIPEPQEIIGKELQINPSTGPSINDIVTKKWIFWTRDKKNRCEIFSNSVIFVIHDYINFDDIKVEILNILNGIIDLDDSIQGKRFGLRYINEITNGDLNKWITSSFINAMENHKNANTIKLEARHEYSIQEKEINVRLLYGYFNPDYPAIMKNETFTIDIDSYSQCIIYKEDIEKILVDIHYEAQDCFEKMITDEFRNVLNQEE